MVEPLDQGNTIGRRIRETRDWRKLSLKVVAGLAGISVGHLSNIEHGRRQVDKRSLLEAIAGALRVAPSDLAKVPFPPRDDVTAEAMLAVSHIEGVIADIRLDDPVEVTPRPWAVVARDLARVDANYRSADYAAQGQVLPLLVEELHALYANDAEHRTDALTGLITCYHAAAMVANSTGVRGVAQLAADRGVTVAERLGRAEWVAHAAWVRAQVTGSANRQRQLKLINRSISAVEGETMTAELLQTVGQLHLSAAMSNATLGKEDDAWTHFREAEALANKQEEEVGQFGLTWFGRPNVRIWQAALATEFGYGGKVLEMVRGAHPELIPSAVRQSEFYADLGRALAPEKKTRGEAIRFLARAEELAPQRIRNMPFVRETVGGLRERVQNDALGVELRGMAYRMGLDTAAA